MIMEDVLFNCLLWLLWRLICLSNLNLNNVVCICARGPIGAPVGLRFPDYEVC